MISGSLIWSKTVMELILNPCGEFWWSPEGPLSQIHSPHLHAGAPGIIPDLLRPVQMLKREWGAESKGKLPHIFFPSKTETFVPDFAMVPEFAVKDLSLGQKPAFGQNCSLGAWVCSERPGIGQNTLMMMTLLQWIYLRNFLFLLEASLLDFSNSWPCLWCRNHRKWHSWTVRLHRSPFHHRLMTQVTPS